MLSSQFFRLINNLLHDSPHDSPYANVCYFSGSNGTRLISPVISAALLCGDTVCNTSLIQIEDPVQIELEHENQVTTTIIANDES